MQDYHQDRNEKQQPVYSVPATPLGKNSQSDYYYKNKQRRPELVEQKLTAKSYREKFHELLAYEEEEHEKILKERFG